jgi:pimeloyl-ACP methyl ester carboxylesterase
MMGGAKAHYEGIKAFSETDLTDDLKGIGLPTLVMHGDDDQVVQGCCAARDQAPQARHAEDLPRIPARPDHVWTLLPQTSYLKFPDCLFACCSLVAV